MKRTITILLLLCTVLTVFSLDQRQTKINTIKKSKEYLYSDITMSSRQEAVSQAYDMLQDEILQWAKDRAKNPSGSAVSPKDLNQLIDTILVRRANMYRVFAYVKKSKLLPLFSDWYLKLKDDELGGNDNKPVQPAQTKESPRKEPVANEPIRTLLKNNYLGRKGGVLEKIKKAKYFFELKEIMEPLKEKGDILDYGKYATAQHPEDAYLIVYDPAGNIKAVLGKGADERINLKTGKSDSVENYRGCGAIWFTMKNE